MGLFSKREPCAVCGGKVTGLFPWKIDGELVCNDCHGQVDLPDGMESSMSMEDFKQYRIFREENQKLGEDFKTSQVVDFGFFETSAAFDFQHGLFCFDKDLDTTIFRRGELKSFVVKEDSNPIFRGDGEGLVRYESSVPDILVSMAPQLAALRKQNKLNKTLELLADSDNDYTVDVPEPFDGFNIELTFEHPYWDTMYLDAPAPTFNDDTADIEEYLFDYRECVRKIEEFVTALMTVAFPGTPERTEGAAKNAAPAADAADQIGKFKALLDSGAITQEEFDAKKRQLLEL